MGKWNYRRRWKPRNYRDQRIPSPPTYYDTEYKLREAWKNAELSWEERFCISVGIPWEKVVTAKKYMYCHDDVVKWNDSAGEETFCNAKNRFWAKINGLHSDIPEPDPDMYVDEIDWNPKIDTELVKELDRAFFNPDEAEKVENGDITEKHADALPAGQNAGWNDKNPGNNDNPWECNNNGILDNVPNGWNKLGSRNISDPWEQGNTQNDGEIKDIMWGRSANKLRDRDITWGGGGNSSRGVDITWGGGRNSSQDRDITWGSDANNSWNWNQRPDERLDTTSNNTWDRGGRTAGFLKETGWRNNRNSCGWNGWDSRDNNFRHSGYVDNSQGRQPSGAPKHRQKGSDCSFGREQWHSQRDKSTNLDHRRHNDNGGGWESNIGSRKREVPQQHASSHKSARVQENDYGTGSQWRRQRT